VEDEERLEVERIKREAQKKLEDEAEEKRREEEEQRRKEEELLLAKEEAEQKVGAKTDIKIGSNRMVFVSNISHDSRASNLRNLFQDCGAIVSIEQKKDKGVANIEFDTEEAAAKAVALNGILRSNQRPLRILLQAVPVAVEKEKVVPFKTRMCNYFAQGKCFKDTMCSFAHHPRELPEHLRAQGGLPNTPTYRTRGGAAGGRGTFGGGRGKGGVDGGLLGINTI